MIPIQAAFRAFLLALLFVAAASAFAQDWPSKPVRIVFPYPPGGSGDAVARNLARRIEALTQQNVTVENLTGGASVVAAQNVINSPADGTKLYFTGSSTVTVMKHVTRLPFDPEKELTPITFVNTLPHWLVVRSDRPEKTLQDFIETIRANPGKVNISVNGMGGMAHLALANWAKNNRLDFAIVPYRGSPPAMVDLIGGVTTAHVDVVGSSMPFVKDRRAKALALLRQTPHADLPDVPVSPAEDKEGLVVDGQHLLAVKAGTPPATVERIYQVVKQATAEPGFIEFLKGLGYERSVPTPAQTKELLARDANLFGEIVRRSNIKID